MRSEYSAVQLTALVALRFTIGWHFFYEGVSKLVNPYWTAAGYLEGSQGFMSDLFLDLASNPGTLAFVDGLNVWGLMLVGLGLMLNQLKIGFAFNYQVSVADLAFIPMMLLPVYY